jgi:hypothetical protein
LNEVRKEYEQIIYLAAKSITGGARDFTFDSTQRQENQFGTRVSRLGCG